MVKKKASEEAKAQPIVSAVDHEDDDNAETYQDLKALITEMKKAPSE